MSLREQFHANRRKVVGGSDVACLFGLDRFKNVRDLWMEKTGQTPPDELATPDIRRGRRQEPIILTEAEERLNAKSPGRLQVNVPFLVHPQHPFLGGHVDAMWYYEAARPESVIEAKAPNRGAWGKIQREGLPYSNLLQMQTYLEVHGLDDGYFAVYCADSDDFVMMPIVRDFVVGQRIIEAAGEFWRHVEAGTEPPEPTPDEVAEVEKMIPTSPGEVTFRTDAEWQMAVNSLRESKLLKQDAEAIEDAAKARIMELAGGYGVYEGGAARIYYREMQGRKSFNRKALEATKPLDRISVAALIDEAVEKATLWTELRAHIFDAIQQGHADVDFSQFEERGKPFVELRPYFLRGAE